MAARAGGSFAASFAAFFGILPPLNANVGKLWLLGAATFGATCVAAVVVLWTMKRHGSALLVIVVLAGCMVTWPSLPGNGGDAVGKREAKEPSTPSSTSPADPTTTQNPPSSSAGPSTSYDVNAEPGSSVDIGLADGGTATQEFVAVSDSVSWVGVIAGCDGAIRPDCGPGVGGGYFGQVQIQVLDGDEVLGTATVATINNRMSEAGLDRVATTIPGETYTLLVTNMTGNPMGVYVTQSDVHPDLDTVITGAYHGERNEGSIPHDLAALVDTR